MLSEIEVAQFKNRIDDVLSNRPLTDWQRRFLTDIRGKIGRYGVRTRLTEKQRSMLVRLTQRATEHSVRTVPDSPQPKAFEAVERTVARPRPAKSFGRIPLRRNPLRFRNPFRPRYLLRSPRAFRLLPVSSGKLAIATLAVLLIAGSFGSLFNRDVTIDSSALTMPSEMNTPASATSGRADFSITDGDTIRLRDGTPARLVGFEGATHRLSCLWHHALGVKHGASECQLQIHFHRCAGRCG
jgi:hypothetical protein